MKIIDKRGNKDYYDYLAGIYGIDEKLILDRRNKDDFYLSQGIFRLYIGGYMVEGLHIDNKFYYGEDLLQFEIKDTRARRWLSKHYVRDYDKSIEISYNTYGINHSAWVYLEEVKDIENINNKENCPILYKEYQNKNKFPTLKSFNLSSFIAAEEIYKWLESWLSARITVKENISIELTNAEKILNKGFDKKRSFRPKSKK